MAVQIDGTGNCLLSNNERQFILKALEGGHRIDGRKPYDFRKLQVQISIDGSTISVQLGKTLVAAAISATLEQPVSERPNEGVLRINMEHVPMAAPGYDADSRNPDTNQSELQGQLEKAIRDVRAVDLEALCILPGRKVWRVQLDVRLLDAGGNTTDAVFIAALTALMAFRRPEVSVEQGEDGTQSSVAVHSMEEREALSLGLHQTPLSVTFAVFKNGDLFVVDPSIKEEAASLGVVTVVMNAHNEVCLLQKSGGLGLTISQVMQLVRLASVKVAELSEKLKAAFQAHETARVAARIRRKQPQKPAAAGSRSVSVLNSSIVTGELRDELGEDLKALQLAVEAVSSSDDEELPAAKVQIELGATPDAKSEEQSLPSASENSSDAEKHVPVGVLAPSGDEVEACGMETDAEEASPSDRKGLQDEDMPGVAEQDPYAHLAAKIAGAEELESASLQKAIKKKRKRQKGLRGTV